MRAGGAPRKPRSGQEEEAWAGCGAECGRAPVGWGAQGTSGESARHRLVSGSGRRRGGRSEWG